MKNRLRNNRRLYALFFVFASLCASPAFTQTWTSSRGFGSSLGTDRASGVAMDAAGNVYITGAYTGTIDFGNGPLPAAGVNSAQTDGFVAKFSPSGTCLWSLRFNGPDVTSLDQGLGIATNGTSVFVAGVFQGSLSVNGGVPVPGYGNYDGFGIKLDAATGATQWVTVFGGPSQDGAQSMCIDNAGNMYASGYFITNSTNPTATFGSFQRSVNGNTASDAFVVKMNGVTGNIDWVSTGGSASYNDNVSNCGIAYAPAQNAIVMAGSFQAPNAPGTVATYSTTSPASSVSLTNAGGTDICVLELSASTGAFLSAVSVGSSSNEESIGATYDLHTQQVMFTGYFISSTLTFGTNPSLSYTTGGSGDDTFIAAYDPANNTFSWAKKASSSLQDRGQGLGSNGQGQIFVTGRYRGTYSASTASSSISINSNRGTTADELFLLQLNAATGNAEALLTPQNANTNTAADYGIGIAARAGTIWVGGMFGSTATFSSLTSITSSGNTSDVLLARYSDPNILPVKMKDFTAKRVKDDVVLAWRTESETAHDRFEIERSADGRTFTHIGQRRGQPLQTIAEYTFTDLSAMSGEPAKLLYRLKIVGTDGRATYSAVVSVTSSDDKGLRLAATPNPFMANLNIQVTAPAASDATVVVSSAGGNEVARQAVKLVKGTNSINFQDTGNWPGGIYLLQVIYDGKTVTQRLMKN